MFVQPWLNFASLLPLTGPVAQTDTQSVVGIRNAQARVWVIATFAAVDTGAGTVDYTGNLTAGGSLGLDNYTIGSGNQSGGRWNVTIVSPANWALLSSINRTLSLPGAGTVYAATWILNPDFI